MTSVHIHGFGPNGELSPGAEAALTAWAGPGGGVTDHGALSGLDDDDHPQYHTDARGDVRYYTKSQTDALLSGATPVPAAGGYDVILLAGQSNMVGWSATGSTDLTDPIHPMIDYVDCYGYNGDLGVIKPATRTMDFRSGVGGISPGLYFARWYISSGLNNGRKVLLVPSAANATPLVQATGATWNPASGSLYTDSLNRIADGLAVEGSKVVAILWIQGESDGADGVGFAEYQAAIDNLITKYREDIPGGSQVPFIIGQTPPDYLAAETRAAISAAQSTVPGRFPWTAFVPGPRGTYYHQGDGNHYGLNGAREMGKRMFQAFERATVGLAAVDPAYRPVIVSSTAPVDRTAVWIDHSGVAEPVKLWNGTAWAAASTGYTTTTTTVPSTTTTTTTAAGTTTTTTTAATTTTTTTSGLPGGWTPADLTSLHLWLDASTLTGLSEGADVNTWPDLSTNGYDATDGPTTNPPSYTTANGYAAVSFNGTNEMLTTSAVQGGAATAFLVARRTVDSNGQRAGIGAVGSGQLWSLGYATSTGDIEVRVQNGISSTLAFGESRAGEWTAIGASIDATSRSIWWHGNLAPTTTTQASSLNATAPLQIGRLASGATFFDGEIAEVIYCSDVLSATDRGYVMAYLADKYTLT